MTQRLGRSLTFFSIVLASILFATATPVLAQEAKTISVKAEGQIIAYASCGDNVCQVASIAGTSSRLGGFVGELHENVDVSTGAYTGDATFTFANGSITTHYTGQVLSEVDGLVTFHEDHLVVSATGRLTGTTGTLDVLGTADAAGALSVSGTGVIIR